MLAKIDDFTFEINDTSFESIELKSDFRYATQKRLKNFDIYQAVNSYAQSITINGELIAKSQIQLKAFEDMANEKKERTMVFADGTAKSVLILSFNRSRDTFLKDGAFLKQGYTIKMAVIL